MPITMKCDGCGKDLGEAEFSTVEFINGDSLDLAKAIDLKFKAYTRYKKPVDVKTNIRHCPLIVVCSPECGKIVDEQTGRKSNPDDFTASTGLPIKIVRVELPPENVNDGTK